VGIYDGDLPIAMYLNHISLTVHEAENEPYILDMENPLFGASACGEDWSAYVLASKSTEPMELLIHNPHRFGNENAVDELLSNMALWSGIDFEKGALAEGEAQRNMGFFFVIIAMALLGIALFSTLIHIKNSNLMWLLGFSILSAGIYFLYSAEGVSVWQDSIVSNTTMLGIAMMLYMFFLSLVIVCFLIKTKKLGMITVVVLGAADFVMLGLPVVTQILFYDLWFYWLAVQLTVNLLLFVCIVKEFCSTSGKQRWLHISAFFPLLAFGVDVAMTKVGAWQGGLASKYVFVALFVVAMVAVLRIIPHGINAAAYAKELETEKTRLNAQLTQSRISTMMSQIRPHFIYNTLGSIEQLCEIDPAEAGRLVHNFAKYLRGNFGELDNPRPIQMSKEMEHVHYYVSIEKVRFPDMTFRFEMNSVDFCLPALTIQPIVENAIKHGLMKREKGGCIQVVSYETDTHYCIEVEDDGMGFDTGVLLEGRDHMGIRNIRERLKAMVDGTLEIESTFGIGTKVLISIPKEVRK
jgi:sensor histidine kinase YesM